MKKIWIVIGIVVVLALAIVLFVTLTKKKSENYRIGLMVPLTGAGANYGEWTRNGVQAALDEINVKGIRGKRLEVIIEDHKNDPKEAVAIMNKFVSIQHLPIILIITSSSVLAVSPIAEKTHTLILNTAALNSQIRYAGDYIFSNIPDADVEVKAMAEFAYKKLGIHELAIFNSTSGSGIGAKDALVREFPALGGKILGIETHDEGDADFRGPLTKLKRFNPPAIYLASTTRESALILKQAQEIGFRTQWLSYTPFQGPDILNIAGKAAEGVIYTTYSLAPEDPKAIAFITKYKAKYGSEPEFYAGTAYDGMKLIALAIEKVGYDAERIKNFLYSVKDYPGVTGLTTFDKDGCVIRLPVFKTVKDGKFVIYGE